MAGIPTDLVLLRNLLPDIPLRAGDVLPARVLGPRTLALAGARITAELPPELAEGTRLRLRVAEASSERLVLRVVEGPAEQPAGPGVVHQPQDPLAAAIRAGLAVALPGGAVARLFVEPDDEAGSSGARRGPSRVTLRYEAAAMGRVDLVLELLPGAVAATVHAAAGVPADRLRERAGELRSALVAATGRPASVSVRARGETVDVRA